MSAGGSLIQRYAKWLRPQAGIPDEPVEEYARQREAVYAELFGEAVDVYHEVMPMVPHIDVFRYHRMWQDKRTTVLVTSGMSDVPMTLPRGAKDVERRAELIFYCNEPSQGYRETLRMLARFPHDNRTWLYHGHTIPNGNPPEPFWGSEILDTVLLMPTIVAKDRALPEKLQLGGDRVQFLWVVPLSGAECELKLKKGFSAILELFGKHQHPHVFDPERKSYV